MSKIILIATVFVISAWPKQEEKTRDRAFIYGARELSHAWVSGRHARSKASLCPHLFFKWPLSPEVLKCNPLFLKCLFENRPLESPVGKISIHFKQKDLPYKIVSKSQLSKVAPGYALEVALESSGGKRIIWLEDTCSSVYLLPRPYLLESNLIWDNQNTHWFIDRHQVTNREVLEWIQQTGKKIKMNFGLEDHYRSSINLRPSQMREYCHFRGKQMVSAPLIDAASMAIEDLKDPFSSLPLGHLKPWRVFPKDQRSRCLKIPALECQDKLTALEEFVSAPAWSGIFQVLGGWPERVENPRYPRYNLNISSYYFPFSSNAHNLTKRIYWDGEDHHYTRFSWGTLSLPDHVEKIGVAFRCVRQRYMGETIQF